MGKQRSIRRRILRDSHKLIAISPLGYFELWQKVIKRAPGFDYEIRLKGINDVLYGCGNRARDRAELLQTLERFDDLYGTRDQRDWRKLESGKAKFSKEKVKKLILSQCDNFQAIKKMKQYGVI